jgi:hypothetical protein
MDEAPKPPTRTRRQAQAAARREQFLEVALDLFAERGLSEDFRARRSATSRTRPE